MHSWNLIFDSTTAQGAYQLRSQERLALDTRLNPPHNGLEVHMIQAICFDAFGTLVEITDKRRPFRALLRGGVTGPSN